MTEANGVPTGYASDEAVRRATAAPVPEAPAHPVAPTAPPGGRGNHPEPRRSLGVMAGVILMFLAGFVLLDVLLQNSQRVRFHFLGWSPSLTLSALLFATAFVAVVLDQAVGLIWRRRRRHLLNLEEGRTKGRRGGRR